MPQQLAPMETSWHIREQRQFVHVLRHSFDPEENPELVVVEKTKQVVLYDRRSFKGHSMSKASCLTFKLLCFWSL
jgi:hypothetical protein